MEGRKEEGNNRWKVGRREEVVEGRKEGRKDRRRK